MNAAAFQEALYGQLVDAAPEAILVVDRQGKLVLVNQAAEKLLGAPRAELLTLRVEDLVPTGQAAHHREQRAGHVFQPNARPMGEGRNLSCVRRDGTTLPVDVALSPLPTAEGEFIIAVVRDVSQRQADEDRLRYQGTHDALTGLHNRAFLEDTLERLTRGRQHPVTVVVVDVDGLKQVNDTQGHAAGDVLLQHTAEVLRHAFRADDVLARVGGDEFVAVLPSTTAVVGRAKRARLASLLAEHNAQHPDTQVYLSVGVATAEPGEDLGAVLKRADALMYDDKRQKRRTSTPGPMPAVR